MTRRRFLEALAALVLAGPAFAGDAAGSLRVSGPAVAETLALLRMSRAGALPGIAREAVFVPWNSPDQLRALIATGGVDAAVMTTPSACVLRNKGVAATVVALFSSPVWLVSTDASLSHLSGFDGQEILVPFGPGEMPDLLLRALTGKSGMRLIPRHVGSALEAVNMMLLGRGRHALLSEPAASLAVSRSRVRTNAQLPALGKQLDLRDVWREVFPENPDLALGALVMVAATAQDATAREAVRSACIRAVGWVSEHPREAAALAKEVFPALGSQTVEDVLPGAADIRLLAGPGVETSAWFFLELLHGMSPASIGGKIPEPGFIEVGV